MPSLAVISSQDITYVDCPLKTSQSSNHNDTHRESVPESRKPNVLVDTAHRSTKSFTRSSIRIEFADHDIRRVGDDGAEDACEVATSKRYACLRSLAVVALLAWQAVIDHLDDGLKGGKLHHGVGNLATPKRVDALVQARPALLGGNGADAMECALVWVRHASLHPYLDGFKGTQSNVCEELSRRRGDEIESSLVLVSRLRTCEVRVRFLEVFIEAILEGTLGRVSEKSRAPTSEDTTDALTTEDLAPGLEVSSVQLWVHLPASLDQIQWRDGSVCKALE